MSPLFVDAKSGWRVVAKGRCVEFVLRGQAEQDKPHHEGLPEVLSLYATVRDTLDKKRTRLDSNQRPTA